MENPARTARYLEIVGQRRRDLQDFVGRHLPVAARFVWEIGCGHGHFLTAYAQAHPQRLCIGVDIEAADTPLDQ